jgi:hypothetical protein
VTADLNEIVQYTLAAKGKMHSKCLIPHFLQEHRRQGQQCQRGKMHSGFLLSGEVLVWQLVLVAAQGW